MTLNTTSFQSLKFKPAFYLSLLISIQCLINSVYHEFLSLFIETTTYMQGAWLKYSFFAWIIFQHSACCLLISYLFQFVCFLFASIIQNRNQPTKMVKSFILISTKMAHPQTQIMSPGSGWEHFHKMMTYFTRNLHWKRAQFS